MLKPAERKRVNTTKHTGVYQILLLAGLMLAIGGAQAATPYKVTVNGVTGNSMYNVDGYTGSIAYDPSAILGKAFTLEMIYDATGAVNTPEAFDDIPGAFSNYWQPVTVSFTLTIDGGPVFTNTDSYDTRIESFNDVTVPTSLDLSEAPPGIRHGRTYDGYTIGTGNVYVGCFHGGTNNGCADNDLNNVYESFGIVFDYYWDTAQHNAISDNGLPNPLNFDFTKGFGGADMNFTHWSPDPSDSHDGGDLARIYLSANSVTVAAVPEPETYALLLAGLGLVGFAARRRNA
jgi:hypothetical protein